ncbi:hypothetical protein BMETH_1285_0 [methanotrophic bacterial endosymbiont of Bathymodiolus sp.]|nr:hypothetical protein BMETH_1285_0 [methanotrophic bacterial endosymbiont of Bathymodiolus sp.]
MCCTNLFFGTGVYSTNARRTKSCLQKIINPIHPIS